MILCRTTFVLLSLLLATGCGLLDFNVRMGSSISNSDSDGTGGGGGNQDNLPWNFGTPGDFTFASPLVTTNATTNTVNFVPPNFTFNSSTTFNTGTHSGTYFDTVSNRLSLLADQVTPREAGSAWTPEWNQVIGYWNFNTNLNDSSTYAANLTVNGNAAIGAPLKIGAAALVSDGTSNSFATTANCAHLYSATEMTVAFWAYANTKDDFLRFIEVASSTAIDDNVLFKLYTDNDADQRIRVEFAHAGRGYIITSPGALPLSTWTHVAFTFDGTMLRLFVDGKTVGETDGYGGAAAIAYNADSRLQLLSSTLGYYGNIDGAMDELIIWQKALRPSEIRKIASLGQKTYNGFYVSQPLNGFALTEWSSAAWNTPLPFEKELPGDVDGDNSSDNESVADYADISATLSTGLVGLWHLNETSGPALDSSGNANHGTHQGTVFANQTGMLKRSTFYETNGTTLIPDSPAYAINGNISVQAWIDREQAGSFPTIVSKATNGSDFSFALNFDGTASNIRFLIGDNAGTYDVVSTPAPSDGQWHHVVGVLTATQLRIYIDGILKNQAMRTITPLGISTGQPICLGALTSSAGCDSSHYFGYIDEVGIWNRDLSAAEVLQLYRRGVNRTKFQFRACTMNNCSDNPSWVGPDGTNSTWFSEMQNAATVAVSGETTGTISATGPVIEFLRWISAVTGWQINRPSGRYFQFMTWLETDDISDACSGDTCKPSVSSVTAEGVAMIEASRGLTFEAPLTKFEVTQTGDCDLNSSVKYQISSDDGLTYKYWDGAAWTAVSALNTYRNTNLLATVNTNIGSLATSGKLRFRAFIPTSSTSCALSNPKIE